MLGARIVVVRPVMRTGRATARTLGRSHRQPGRSADRYDGSELGLQRFRSRSHGMWSRAPRGAATRPR